MATGDRVRVRAVDGEHSAVTVNPAPRADGTVPAFRCRRPNATKAAIPAEKHADVVNMSLGASGSGGPLTAAVSQLTRQYGPLFVVAAGNDGCDRCACAPRVTPPRR